MQVMDCAPEIMTYSEGSAPYFESVLLRPLDAVEDLRRRSVFPVVALKPICETHRINELLERFPRSRAIWIFRNYQDAVNSASTKWPNGRAAIKRLASENPESAGWRVGGLSHSKLRLVKDLYSDRMTLHEANAVMWYLRNGLYFELGANTRTDVLLVRYEDLVARPRESLSRMFVFLGCPLPPGFEKVVRSSGGPGRPFPDISPRIRVLCEELHARLVGSYTAASTQHLALDDSGPFRTQGLKRGS
jgi:hypothetical protein